MNNRVISIDADTTAFEIANKMMSVKVSAVLVMDSGRYIGILTERDLTSQVTAKDSIPSKTPATAIMSTPLVSIANDSPIEEAAKLMLSSRIRHLAVTREGEITGVITATDILRFVRDTLSRGERIPPSILKVLYSPEEPTEENIA